MVNKIIPIILTLCLISSPVLACGGELEESPTEILPYTVTKVMGNKYWARDNNNNGLYFTQDYILYGDEIEVGDIVLVTFDSDNLEDGLLSVELFIPWEYENIE